MTRPKGEASPPLVLFVNEQDAAAMLGLGYEKFAALRDQLEASGFPKVDPIIGRRSVAAIAQWERERSTEKAPDTECTAEIVRRRLDKRREQRASPMADQAQSKGS